ncbi:MAG: cell division protein FtsA [Rhizobiaceae bacterium]
MTLLGGRTGLSGIGGKRTGIVTVLDVGSTKVSCMIARLTPRDESAQLPGRTHKVEVLGIGHQRSRGVKSGVVSELDHAETAIRQAVDAAERMAGMTVDSIITNVSAGRIKGSTIQASVSLGNRPVDDNHIGRVTSAASKRAEQSERKVLHVLPVSYSLDAENGIRDPRGMEGSQLGLDVHVITADSAPLRNLELCINRAHLSIESMVATAYASGLSVLVDDEAELGAACIDLGGGTTSIGIFAEGRCIHADAIAIGGNHVTMDLARGLSTRLDEAEALKVRHGNVLVSASDDREMIAVRSISGEAHEEPQQIARAMMTRIIKARVEETLELVRDRINQSGFGAIVGKRVVLTGGASQLQGLPEAARRILGRSVRIGRPLGVAGLPEAAKGPAFAASAGLLIYPQVAELGQASDGFASGWRMTGTGGRFARVGQWLKDSF